MPGDGVTIFHDIGKLDVLNVKIASVPLALTSRGRIAPAKPTIARAGVSTSAMGHCDDIQGRRPY
jgi:hypothetical protein